MRYAILDGFRGFFLLFMGIIHANEIFHGILGKLNHHYFGWVEDAQGFVFISGFVVGLVYGGRYLKKNYGSMFRAVYRRVRTIYSHQAGLILIFLAAALLIGSVGGNLGLLRQYWNAPFEFTVASLLLMANSLHMGILPMYIWYMLITPFVLAGLRHGYGPLILGVAILAWFFAQTGLMETGTGALEDALAARGHPVNLGIFFNILGWQVLFFGGLWLGFKQAAGTLDLSFLKDRAYFWLFLVGMAAMIGFGLLDRVVYDRWISPEFSTAFLEQTNRPNFSVIYPITFALDLFLVTWLLVAGPTCGVRIIALLAALVEWIFTRRFLVFLGQHSLHVFSFHILLVYVLAALFLGRDLPALVDNLMLIGVGLSLYLPAWVHARMLARDKARAQAARAATTPTPAGQTGS